MRKHKYMRDDLFFTCRMPVTIVSDNGSKFRAESFQNLLRSYKIRHTFTASYPLLRSLGLLDYY